MTPWCLTYTEILMIYKWLNISIHFSGGLDKSGVKANRIGGRTPPPVPPPPRQSQSDASAVVPSPCNPLAANNVVSSGPSTGPSITLSHGMPAVPVPQKPALKSDGQSSPTHQGVRYKNFLGNGSAVLVLGGESPTEGTNSPKPTPNSTPNGTNDAVQSASSTPTAGHPGSYSSSHSTSVPLVNGQLPSTATSSASSSPVANPTPPAVLPRSGNRGHRGHRIKRISGWCG